MMSIQVLYSRQVPKTTSINNNGSGGNGPLITNEEVLGILSQVQHREPIGNAVLNAKIALDDGAKRVLELALIRTLATKVPVSDIVIGIAKTAVFEVCGTPVCSRCKGSGVFSKCGVGMVECTKCNGVGKEILSARGVYSRVMRDVSEENKVCRATFTKKYYDIYMDVVDQLHVSEGNATIFAKRLLDRISWEMEAEV